MWFNFYSAVTRGSTISSRVLFSCITLKMQIIWSLQDFKGDKGKAIKVPLAILFGRGLFEIAYKVPEHIFLKTRKMLPKNNNFSKQEICLYSNWFESKVSIRRKNAWFASFSSMNSFNYNSPNVSSWIEVFHSLNHRSYIYAIN